MRNTTKLKQILLKYAITLTMDDDGLFTLALDDKHQHEENVFFEGKSYAIVVDKAHRYMNKKIKSELL
jgi:hypothetical protein